MRGSLNILTFDIFPFQKKNFLKIKKKKIIKEIRKKRIKATKEFMHIVTVTSSDYKAAMSSYARDDNCDIFKCYKHKLWQNCTFML